MTHSATTRRRGGQPGNSNRLRHGLYSRRLFPDQKGASSSTGGPSLRFQRDLARRRLLQLLAQQEGASLRDWLSYERGILHYMKFIIALSQAANLRVDQMRAMPPSADVLTSVHQLDSEIPEELHNPVEPIRTSRKINRFSRDSSPKSPIRTANRSSGSISSFEQERSSDDYDE